MYKFVNSRNHIVSTYDSPIHSDELGITLEEADRYIRNWDSWENCFSKSTLEWILENLSIGDICAIHYIPQKYATPDSYWEKNYERECIDNYHSFEEYQGDTDFHRTVHLPAIGYRVSYQYQNVGNLAKVYKEALLRDYPYLKDYKFESYVPSYGSCPVEIYIKLTYKNSKGEDVTVTLYTPVKALKEKDSMQIYKRHWSYNGDYYRTQPEFKEKILGVLKSREFHELREKVDGKLYNYTGELI